IIKIDIPAKRLDLLVDEKELEERRKTFKPIGPKVTMGYLARYAEQVTSGATGAILKK
ncbi:MAG: dihydroxy-acid dehydratase, partial [Dissulfurimicrobium sp.]